MKIEYFCVEYILQTATITLNTGVNDLALMRLRRAFNFEKASSIGFRSGEYGGR